MSAYLWVLGLLADHCVFYCLKRVKSNLPIAPWHYIWGPVRDLLAREDLEVSAAIEPYNSNGAIES